MELELELDETENIKYAIAELRDEEQNTTNNTIRLPQSGTVSEAIGDELPIKDFIPEESETFGKKVTDFVKNTIAKNGNSPKIFILAPCYGGMCHINFTTSLIQTIQLLDNFKIDYAIEFCKNDSLITRARNNLIAKAMSNKQTTHMMFIDNDITWEPVDIIKLLVSGKGLVGGVYPLKKYNWGNIIRDNSHNFNSGNTGNNENIIQSMLQKKNAGILNNLVNDVDYIRHNMLKYNVNFLSSQLIIDHNNLAKVRHLATGFMMIERNVIEKMIMAFPSTKYVDDVNYLTNDENHYAYTLFDTAVEDGHYLSEDWLFCERWRKMGGDVYIDVSIKLSHSGVENYDGFFLSTIL